MDRYNTAQIRALRLLAAEVHIVVTRGASARTSDMLAWAVQRVGLPQPTCILWADESTARAVISGALRDQDVFGGQIHIWLANGSSLSSEDLQGQGVRFLPTVPGAME